MITSGLIGNLDTASFFTAIPSAMGAHQAMQLKWEPCQGAEWFPVLFRSQTLRKSLAADLHKGKKCFWLKGISYLDEKSTPVENAQVNWASWRPASDWKILGVLTLDQQELNVDQQWCSHLAFSPFNTVDEHIPIGGIARMRKVVYTNIQYERVMMETGHLFSNDISWQDVLARKGEATIKANSAETVEEVAEEDHTQKHEGHHAHHGGTSVHVEVDIQ